MGSDGDERLRWCALELVLLSFLDSVNVVRYADRVLCCIFAAFLLGSDSYSQYLFPEVTFCL